MADKEMVAIEMLRNKLDGQIVLLTPEQLVIVAKKLNVRACRLKKSHLSLLCTVNEVVDKYCEDKSKSLSVLQELTQFLNRLLTPKETASEYSEDAVSESGEENVKEVVSIVEEEQKGKEEDYEDGKHKFAEDDQMTNC